MSSHPTGALSPDLPAFGWRPAFASQLSVDDYDTAQPARVTGVHRNGLDVVAPGLATRVPIFGGEDAESRATVGDWLLLNADATAAERLLDRQSLLKRRAPGTGREVQLIAANIDTLFIVSSCNADFNLARLERYLALAREAGVTPVVLLTKADMTEDPAPYVAEASRLMPGLITEALDATGPDTSERLAPWCGRGQTVAFVGSSGVGKSTLVNALMGDDRMATSGIREDDAKGRHTTTMRALFQTSGGVWVLDTPGMRELQLTDVAAGIEDVFAEIEEAAARCRFRDCTHAGEPGCAVDAAVAAGAIAPDRVTRWRKLMAEDARNSETLHARRSRERTFAKHVRQVIRGKER